jgi:hypothetical protein
MAYPGDVPWYSCSQAEQDLGDCIQVDSQATAVLLRAIYSCMTGKERVV